MLLLLLLAVVQLPKGRQRTIAVLIACVIAGPPSGFMSVRTAYSLPWSSVGAVSSRTLHR